MSSTDSSNSSPYPRENWWGHDPDDSDADSGGHDPAAGSSAREQAAWKAHRFLRDTAPLLCGRAQTEGVDTELTEPSLFPPTDPAARQGNAVRCNPETGEMTGPHGTWVALGDQPAEQFMQLVEACLDLWQAREDLRDRECDKLREHARTAKSDPETTDREIIATLTLAVTSPGSVGATL